MEDFEPLLYYADFCDAPRDFFVNYQDVSFYFGAGFDEALDEYPDQYNVLVLPRFSKQQVVEQYKALLQHTVADLGSIPLRSVCFRGPNRHWAVEVTLLRKLYDQYRAMNPLNP